MARRLTIICAAVLALGLCGCDEEFCAASVDDPIAAILVGLLCAGVDPPPENPPRAVFVMEPTTVDHGGMVRFDASGSRDNGRIVKYEWDLNGISLDGADLRGFEVAAGEEAFDATVSKGALFYSWDLDGDGTFEAGPSTSPGENHDYPTAGQRTVRLRITDALGRSSEAQRVVNVIASRAVASAAAKRRGFRARLTRVRLPDTLRGVAIARFPHGRGTACLRITMATRDRGRPAGRVTVLGGSGDAARLRGGGRFRFAFRDGAPRLAGRLRAGLGRPRPLPPTCPRRTP